MTLASLPPEITSDSCRIGIAARWRDCELEAARAHFGVLIPSIVMREREIAYPTGVDRNDQSRVCSRSRGSSVAPDGMAMLGGIAGPTPSAAL
jgi:hypothetical protein